MAFIARSSDTIGSAGMSVDITDPATACYAGAAVVGATVVVGSVGITTIAAPAVTLVPAVVAGGLYFAGRRMADGDGESATETNDAPAAA